MRAGWGGVGPSWEPESDWEGRAAHGRDRGWRRQGCGLAAGSRLRAVGSWVGEGCNGIEWASHPPCLHRGGRRAGVGAGVEIGDRSDTVGARLGAGLAWAGRGRDRPDDGERAVLGGTNAARRASENGTGQRSGSGWRCGSLRPLVQPLTTPYVSRRVGVYVGLPHAAHQGGDEDWSGGQRDRSP